MKKLVLPLTAQYLIERITLWTITIPVYLFWSFISLTKKRAISPSIKYFRGGLVLWIMVALVFLLWNIISGPLGIVTDNFIFKIFLIFPVIVFTGFLREFLKRIKRHIIKKTFIHEMFPDALKGRQVVRWPIASGVYAVGVLLKNDAEHGISTVMDFMGGPTSLTWNEREVDSSLVSKVEGKSSLDLFSELISLGANKE